MREFLSVMPYKATKGFLLDIEWLSKKIYVPEIKNLDSMKFKGNSGN